MIWEDYINRCEFSSYEDFFENFEIKKPKIFNFTENVVLERCKLTPQKTAIIYINENGNEKTLTYQELWLQIEWYSRFLAQNNIGIRDRVIIRLGRDWRWIPLTLSVIRLGGTVCPIPEPISENEYEKRLKELKAKLVITKENISEFEKTEISENQKIIIPFNLINSDMMIYYTSGSYSRCKQIHHSHLLPLSFIANGKYMTDFSEDDIVYNFAETGWAAYLYSFFCQFWFGYTTLIYDFIRTPNLNNFVEISNKYKLTHFFCSPGILFNLAYDSDIKENSFSSTKQVITAGGILYETLSQNFREKFNNIELLNHYGQTEFMAAVGVYKCFEKEIPAHSIGKPCPCSNLYIKNENEMWISLEEDFPIGLTENMRGLPDYYTGDLITQDENGFLYYYSRKDDIINSSAYRFSTSEVEEFINQMDFVKECAVIGVPDLQKGQTVKAFVILKDDVNQNTEIWEDVIKKSTKKHLDPYKYPRIIEFVKELPKTPSGKIKKGDLK